jgi:hypothetical protein
LAFVETGSSLMIRTVAVATRLTRGDAASGATGVAASNKGKSAITPERKRDFNHPEQGRMRVNEPHIAQHKRQVAAFVKPCAETLQSVRPQ